MIEPEAAPPVPPAAIRRRRRVVVAGVTLVALVAGGIAVARGGGPAEPAPLALMAGSGDTRNEAMSSSAGTAANAPAADSGKVAGASGAGAAGVAPAIAPYPGGGYPGGWGVTFKVDGPLPDLPGRATAWAVSGPALDQAAVARIAGALGLSGTPVAQNGGWTVGDADRTLSAFPGGDTWSVSYDRSLPMASPATPPNAGSPSTAVSHAASSAASSPASASPPDETVSGPALSAAQAEDRVGDLLDRMGAPGPTWKLTTTETEIGPGWACAAPAPAMSPEELKKLEGDKLAQVNAGSVSSAPGVAACPPPPAPVKGFNVGVSPVLDGHRADWSVWNVTMRADGRIENLSGSWATFARAGDYKLRGVDAALKALQSPPTIVPAVGRAVAPDTPVAGGTAGSAGGGAAVPAIAPVCTGPMPLAADRATSSFASDCPAPAPQVVTITGVELGLLQAPVFEDGHVHMDLVPAYRFTGHFDNGTSWSTSVVALHPDAIAPPPDTAVTDDAPAVGKAEIAPAIPAQPAPTGR